VDQEQAETKGIVVEPVRRPAVVETWLQAPEARRAEPLTRLASSVGNRAFSQTVARMQSGEGILPSGLVHPDIEAAIAAASGGGRSLDRDFAAQAGAHLGDSFGDVRVHTDEHAAALSQAVSARAFTVGRDIFFGAGEYSPGTAGGRELLTHELAHVVQQRGAPSGGPLTVSQPGDALEREADVAARGLH
jgi:hypothetical protein